MPVNPLVQSLKGKLIVSVQAYPGEPLRHPETMAQMARACELGGAAAIRCQGLSDIAAIKGRVEIPVIGLWKEGHDGVFITPTLRHAMACVNAGADVVALDATDRPRPDGRTFEETVDAIRSQSDVLIMADCMTIEDIRRAVACGCDLVSTTLSHNKAAIDTTLEDGPDVPLLKQATSEFPDYPIICEGRSSPTTRSSARVTSTPRPTPRPPSTRAPGPSWWAPASRTPPRSPAGSAPRSSRGVLPPHQCSFLTMRASVFRGSFFHAKGLLDHCAFFGSRDDSMRRIAQSCTYMTVYGVLPTAYR